MKKTTGLGLAAAAILGMNSCSKSPNIDFNSGKKITKSVDDTKKQAHKIVYNGVECTQYGENNEKECYESYFNKIKEEQKLDAIINNRPNFTLYGAGYQNKDGGFGGVGFRYEGKNNIFQAEKTPNYFKGSLINVNPIFNIPNLYIKTGIGALQKDFEYKGKTYTANELRLGAAGIFTDKNTYAASLAYIASNLSGLGHANTTSHTVIADVIGKKGNFDGHISAKNTNIYGDNFSEYNVGTGYYPTQNSRIGVDYSSFDKNPSDYSVNAGLTYTFGGNKKGKLTPYLRASYNSSKHTTTTLNYENNIANKPIHLRDEFSNIINSSTITAQRNGEEFNKRLDQNIEDKNKAPIAKDDIAKVQEGGIYNIDVLSNDRDPEGEKLNITKITKSNGKFSIENNKILFKAEKPGTFFCNYTITDGGKFATAKLTVTVIAKPKPVQQPQIQKPTLPIQTPQPTPTPTPNTKKPPVAVNDSVVTTANTPVIIDVLKNDTDLDTKKENLTILGTPTCNNGTCSVVDNKIKFIPKKDFTGTATIQYFAFDGDSSSLKPANVTVTVNEKENPEKPNTTAPVITLNGSSTINLVVGQKYVEKGATAIDDIDGKTEVVIKGSVDTNKAGTYVITYSSKDKEGNIRTKKRTVIVKEKEIEKDTIAPTLSSKNKTFTTIEGKPLTLETVTATDNVDGTVTVVKTGNPDFNTPGTYKVVYTATDAAGNTSSITHTYIVEKKEVPNTAPVLKSVSVSGDTVNNHGNNNYSISSDEIHGITFFANGTDVDGDNLHIVINGTLYSGTSKTITLNLGNSEVKTFEIQEFDGEKYSNKIVVNVFGR